MGKTPKHVMCVQYCNFSKVHRTWEIRQRGRIAAERVDLRGFSACRYHISTHLSARLGRLNPTWLSVETDTDKIFPDAMALAGLEFT